MSRKRKIGPSTAQKLADEMDLEDLRWRRDLAQRDGDFQLALTLAIAIDIKRGFYGNPPGGKAKK